MDQRYIRVRFAPSPTGPLHIGGVRTALYNFLFARKNGGKFILRIEDTDRNRYVPNADEYIFESLDWCGIHFDESPIAGGPFGPYRQSERKDIYRQYAERLVREGHGYYAFDTEDELDAMRERLKSELSSLAQYGPSTRMSMKNSLTLSTEEVKNKLSRNEPFVIRIKIPENEDIIVNDLIRGEVKVHSHTLDDKILFKSDGWPTYHLANIVDDHLMDISHVIRGEEWLPSAPLHILLYRYFGWEDTIPIFAHLPLLLKPDGNGKLSKRDGDRLGFPVFPLQWTDPETSEILHGYREDGYLPEAFINILALLGWNPGTEQELFTIDELIREFSLERVGKHGSKFDPEKAKWFNHHYISSKPSSELLPHLKYELSVHRISATDDYMLKVLNLTRERAVLLPDLWKNSWFFFQAPFSYDEKLVQKIWNPPVTVHVLISSFVQEVQSLSDWSSHEIHDFIQGFIARANVKMGQLMNPLRLLLVGSNQGPGITEIASLLGKDEFLTRIRAGLDNPIFSSTL